MRSASTSGRWAQCCCSPARARQVIAKRIDRGQLVVMKALTRSPIVIREIIVVGEGLRKGVRSTKEIVRFDDEELTEEKITNKTEQKLRQIEKIAELYKTALKQAKNWRRPQNPRGRPIFESNGPLAGPASKFLWRYLIDISFHWLEKKRLVDKMRLAVEGLHAAELTEIPSLRNHPNHCLGKPRKCCMVFKVKSQKSSHEKGQRYVTFVTAFPWWKTFWVRAKRFNAADRLHAWERHRSCASS